VQHYKLLSGDLEEEAIYLTTAAPTQDHNASVSVGWITWQAESGGKWPARRGAEWRSGEQALITWWNLPANLSALTDPLGRTEDPPPFPLHVRSQPIVRTLRRGRCHDATRRGRFVHCPDSEEALQIHGTETTEDEVALKTRHGQCQCKLQRQHKLKRK
jgi:hypothetical protein